jgi:hypothetical protein
MQKVSTHSVMLVSDILCRIIFPVAVILRIVPSVSKKRGAHSHKVKSRSAQANEHIVPCETMSDYVARLPTSPHGRLCHTSDYVAGSKQRNKGPFIVSRETLRLL